MVLSSRMSTFFICWSMDLIQVSTRYSNKYTALYTITLLNVLPSILLCIFFTYCIALYTVTALILPNSCNSSNSWSLEIFGLEKTHSAAKHNKASAADMPHKLAISLLICMLPIIINCQHIVKINRYLLSIESNL